MSLLKIVETSDDNFKDNYKNIMEKVKNKQMTTLEPKMEEIIKINAEPNKISSKALYLALKKLDN